mmetsp:Transcript_11162/g.12240  ORF Transcript_11162/g.12240 Transcript_11162/m.12240 type:complete len:296 (-) Transcript_11162:144-1031(-)
MGSCISAKKVQRSDQRQRNYESSFPQPRRDSVEIEPVQSSLIYPVMTKSAITKDNRSNANDQFCNICGVAIPISLLQDHQNQHEFEEQIILADLKKQSNASDQVGIITLPDINGQFCYFCDQFIPADEAESHKILHDWNGHELPTATATFSSDKPEGSHLKKSRSRRSALADDNNDDDCNIIEDNVVECAHCKLMIAMGEIDAHEANHEQEKRHEQERMAEERRKQEDVCVICTEEFNDEETRYLPCFHRFHEDCISAWLKKRNKCPICLNNAHAADGAPLSDDEGEDSQSSSVD